MEIDANDLEAGSTFFTVTNIEKHIAIFGRPPKTRWDVDLARGVANDSIPMILKKKDLKKVLALLPALQRPTVSTLSDPAWRAIVTIIDEKIARDLMPALKDAGAAGIVEYPLNKIIP